MRILFLLFFGYLVYRFLIKPILLGVQGANAERARSPQENLLEMMRRMEDLKRQQYQQQQQPQKAGNAKKDGEYIDYEEVD